MGTFSIWHWLIVIIWIVAFGFPIARVLQRVGVSRWFVILAFIPIVNIVALWVFAYASWPIDKNGIDPKTFG